MIVTPIAHTSFLAYGDQTELPTSVRETAFAKRLGDNYYYSGDGIDTLHEFAGRACYQAWEMPNPETAHNKGYLSNIINQGHFSVMEHGSVTFYVEGVSRALTHELIRHRHLSYSELSQRYVDMSEASAVVPPLFSGDDKAEEIIADVLAFSKEAYERLVDHAVEGGAKRKQAREAARAVLPNVETKIVVTGNLRAWRDMLYKRWHVAADAEIRQFAGEVLKHLRDIAPYSIQDIPDRPFE